MRNNHARYGSTVEFSEDENTATVDGHRYTAVDTPNGECTGCIFKAGVGCSLCDSVLQQEGLYSKKTARCIPGQRKDGRGITWRIE